MTDPLVLQLKLLALNAVIGGVMPPLISMVTRVAWPKHVKAAVALASCAVVAVVVALAEGLLTGLTAGSTLQLAWMSTALIAPIAVKTYDRWWKGTDVADFIEANVNPGSLEGLSEAVRRRVADMRGERDIEPGTFYEADEDVADVRATFYAGERRVTRDPMDAT